MLTFLFFLLLLALLLLPSNILANLLLSTRYCISSTLLSLSRTRHVSRAIPIQNFHKVILSFFHSNLRIYFYPSFPLFPYYIPHLLLCICFSLPLCTSPSLSPFFSYLFLYIPISSVYTPLSSPFLLSTSLVPL